MPEILIYQEILITSYLLSDGMTSQSPVNKTSLRLGRGGKVTENLWGGETGHLVFTIYTLGIKRLFCPNITTNSAVNHLPSLSSNILDTGQH